MSDPTGDDEIQVSVDRSRSALESARELLDSEHYDDAASRAYYAAFHAATAALLSKGLRFSKHRGLIAAVHRDLVRPGLLSTDVGRVLGKLFELRDTGDYVGIERVTPRAARHAVALAESFVDGALRLLEGA